MTKNICKRKKETANKQHKAIDNYLDDIKTYIEELTEMENIIKNEKSFFKSIIISKDKKGKFENEETKKIIKKQLLWLIQLVN